MLTGCLNLCLKGVKNIIFKEMVSSEFFSGTHEVIFGKCADGMSESLS